MFDTLVREGYTLIVTHRRLGPYENKFCVSTMENAFVFHEGFGDTVEEAAKELASKIHSNKVITVNVPKVRKTTQSNSDTVHAEPCTHIIRAS